MTTLILDAGNTRLMGALWAGQAPRRRSGRSTRLRSPEPLTEVGSLPVPDAAADPAEFRDGFQRLHQAAGRGPVVLVSVVPRVVELLPPGLDLTVVDHRSSLPFDLAVAEPALVGPDRLCNMAAAVFAGLDSALVVDAGTATTFDLLIDGVFIGGMIAPGMAFAARRLGEEAARLAPVPFGPVDWEVGTDTAAAMAAGSWHVGTGGIRAAVAGLRARYGEVPIVATGGLGGFFAADGWHHDPHWTLRGAALLAGV